MATLVHQDATSRVRTERNLVLVDWYDAPTMAQVVHYEAAMRSVARAYGADQSASLQLIHGGMPDFREDLRAWATRALRDPTLPQKGAVFTVLIGGMAGAATRAFVSTAQLLARPVGPVKVFGDLPSTARWIEQALASTQSPFPASELLALCAPAER